ncbi:hypothetical protein FIBSPDRAFT_1042635 [Athelia psychrophila]|uniref:TOM13-domain-containing protein n=1 Tax=Athelia psychrophila TaxID=1759441 RepID=A0A166M9V8_9AGAM|nr:hypothetical protein FIBSPDRAFT_1042635 [Fibularhizoctonia sp. CBS 109695]
MPEQSSPLEADGEKLLQSALATAFTPAPTFRPSGPAPDTHPTSPPPAPPPAMSDDPSAASSSSSMDDSWKSEYETQVQSWRAESAEAREKAERERAKWEEIRAKEKEQQAQSEPPQAPAMARNLGAEPSPADVRDLVAGEKEGNFDSHAHQDTGDESKASSQKWSDIHSDLTSSYPSMSFPSPSRPPSPTQSHTKRKHPLQEPKPYPEHPSHPDPPHPSAPSPTSTTLAIFDPNLPTSTRVGALFTSLGINLVLPFVNGVMLGFGEIFAKNIVLGWLGWKGLPGASVANVGVRPPVGRR